jgi:hypothetical protein
MAPSRLDTGSEAGYARQDALVPIESTLGLSLGAAGAGGAGDIVVRARPSQQLCSGLDTVSSGDWIMRGFPGRGRAKPQSGRIARCGLPDLRGHAVGVNVGGFRTARSALAHELSFDQAASARGIGGVVFAACSVSGPRTPRGLTQAPFPRSLTSSPLRR